MTTQTDAPMQRVFKYGAKTFPDPGWQYTTEQVLAHLRQFFPELGQAKTEEKELADGTKEITFSKQVTRKGASLPENDPQACGAIGRHYARAT